MLSDNILLATQPSISRVTYGIYQAMIEKVWYRMIKKQFEYLL